MTVPVTIGGEGPFRFMLDTGAQATVVSRGLADRLCCNDRKPAILVGMASSRTVETTPIDDVRLGSRMFYIRKAPVVEGANIGGADGILGLDSLQDQRVLLDFVKEEISVADAEDLGGNRGYEIVVSARERLGQLIITEARLDGIRVAVVVDSGAQGSIGNPALLERFRRARNIGEYRGDRHQRRTRPAWSSSGASCRSGRASCRTFRSCSPIRRPSPRSVWPTSRR